MKEDIFLEVNRRIHRNLRKRFWLKASAIAASIALLLGVSNYISYHEGYKNQNSQMVEMANPMGMRSSIVLSDGTRVILNAGTTLSYPAAFVSNQREVKVNGEVFFEVSHDKDHPFIVSAENVKVKVLRQYVKNIGNEVEMLLKNGSKLTGVLKSADENGVVVSVEKKVKPEGAKRKVTVVEDESYTFDEIKYTKYLIRFK